MLPANVHPKLGRIVATTKLDKGLSVTAGEFSVLMSDGFFSTNVDETRNNGMRNTKRFGDVRFYVTEEDAMEESAYLVNLLTDELSELTIDQGFPQGFIDYYNEHMEMRRTLPMKSDAPIDDAILRRKVRTSGTARGHGYGHCALT